MSTVQDLAIAYDVIRRALVDIDDAWEHSTVPAEFRAWEMREKLIEAWTVEHERLINPLVTVPEPTTPQPVLPAPTQQAPVLAGLGTSAAAPAEPGNWPGTSYESWDMLAQEVSRTTPDLVRQWFKEVGGWDTSTPEQRAQQFDKAVAYYRNKNAFHASDGNGNVDTSRCYECGSPGIEKRRFDNNELYYECSNERCGFQGDRGWISTKWDPDTWAEKRRRMEQARQRGQQRGRSSGRSYGGTRR